MSHYVSNHAYSITKIYDRLFKTKKYISATHLLVSHGPQILVHAEHHQTVRLVVIAASVTTPLEGSHKWDACSG